ncbi:vacuolar protein sorting-associated protein 4-like isoform X2 [Ischnura elegans]|nr:vacuolar protein sorting-associated protein 4-like isoform X2 [Ischnura elegans]
MRIIHERTTVAEDNEINAGEEQYTLYTCVDDEESCSAESGQMDIQATLTVCTDAIKTNNSEPEGNDDILKSLLTQPALNNGLEDVAGLFEAKRLLNQAIILPLKYPQLFQGARRPWKRILLYGPPGTGKTRLAHAVARQAGVPFYCVSSADLLSSWVGESEKLVRGIFKKINQADHVSIIFIDEIDGLCRRRNSKEEDHCRRMKTELLRQLEECGDDSCSNNAILLGATNCPWDLDAAFLRRFQRRIYIPLPDRNARRRIIELHSMVGEEMNHAPFTESEWDKLLDATDGYSGSDLANLTMSALLEPIKDLEEANFWVQTADGKMVPCPDNHPGAMNCKLQDIEVEKVTSREVNISDYMKGLANTRPTTAMEDITKHNEFTKKLGLTG